MATLDTLAQKYGLGGSAAPSDLEALAQKHGVLGATIQPSDVDSGSVRDALPKTYGFVAGALGTAPDQLEGSVMEKGYEDRKAGAEAGYYVGQAAQALPLLRGAGKVAKAVAEAPGVRAGSAAGQQGVVKLPGGNWLPRNKNFQDNEFDIAYLKRAGEDPHTAAVNNWIDGPLKKYLKNDLATPKDPVRLGIERRETAYEADVVARKAKIAKLKDSLDKAKSAGSGGEATQARLDDAVEELRTIEETTHTSHGFEDPPRRTEALHRYSAEALATPEASAAGVGTKMGTTRAGRDWEAAADASVEPLKLKNWSHRNKNDQDGVVPPEWVGKADPQSTVYVPREMQSQLGLEHIADELRNVTSINSDLPVALRLPPEKLKNLSVDAAVEHIAKVNTWRTKTKQEASLAKANSPAVHLLEQYDDTPQGLKWVELKKPADGQQPLHPGLIITGDEQSGWKYQNRTPNKYGSINQSPPYRTKAEAEAAAADSSGHLYLDEALKYEGSTMGHCVGGYSADVAEGRSRILSLRDKRGAPHVTIELKPAGSSSIRDLKAGTAQQWEVHQVKGTGNARPSDRYLPYVQDYLNKSGYEIVGDYENTGLPPRR